jgi:hypothetical protein
VNTITHLAVFVVFLVDATALWIWPVVLVRLGVNFEAYRRYRIARFRKLDARERHGLFMGLGVMIIELMANFIYTPLSLSDSARTVAAYYPPMALVTGMIYFIAGSTYWGRLLAIGLAMIALAPLLAAFPDYSPLLFGLLCAPMSFLWAYAARNYFGPQANGKKTPVAT